MYLINLPQVRFLLICCIFFIWSLCSHVPSQVDPHFEYFFWYSYSRCVFLYMINPTIQIIVYPFLILFQWSLCLVHVTPPPTPHPPSLIVGFVQVRVSSWSFSILPSPISELQHTPLPLQSAVSQGAYPNSLLFRCLLFGFTFESLKELGALHFATIQDFVLALTSFWLWLMD